MYLEFLEKLFNNPAAFPDIQFALEDDHIAAHRFMLAARCRMLGKRLLKLPYLAIHALVIDVEQHMHL